MHYKLLLISVPLLFVAGCATKDYRQATTAVDVTHSQIDEKLAKSEETAPPVRDKIGYYVNANPVAFNTKPAWLKQKITMRASQMPMKLLMSRLLRDTNVTASFDGSVEANRPVTMDYSGTREGALNNLEAQTDYHYTINHQNLDWSAFETKTFNISFMPGTSNYMVGQKENGSRSMQSMQASNSRSGASSSQLNDDQYSNLHGDLSVWHDLSDALNNLKSKEGKVLVSESTTTVTVQDRPENVQAMARYIKQLNNVLSKEVAIKVRVLDVDLNNESNYGVNWNIVGKAMHSQYKILGNLADATNLVATQVGSSTDSGSSTTGIQLGSDKSNALINAIAQQGKVRVVNQPQVVTLNNQIATIKITQDTGYVQSLTSATSYNGVVSNSINPGTVTEGLTLYLLPKIQDNYVYMQITSTISNLLRLDKVSNEPANSGENNKGEYQAIQVPTITSKSFNQRSMVQTGSTLIIAGYKKLNDETKSASMMGFPQLGSKGTKAKHTEMVVLITPVIINNGAA